MPRTATVPTPKWCVKCGDGLAKTRGLCQTCYNWAYRHGVVEKYALPAKGRGDAMTARMMANRHGDIQLQRDGYSREWTGTEWKPQHRLVMERLLGRPLAKGENVHHLNGVRHDNRPENLELWFSAQPYGQRVSDLLDYVVEVHAEELRRRLLETSHPNGVPE